MDPAHLVPGIFLHPRPKKNVLSAPNKRRKIEHKIEEISFNDTSRADYLTGFHKRKLQRAKRAQEEAAKKEREERVDMRKQLREERKQELEEHVQAINAALRAVGDPDVASEDSDAWGGFSDSESSSIPRASAKAAPVVDHEEEYVSEDEGKFTTVTIEAVDVSKEGLHKVVDTDEDTESQEWKGEKVREEKGKKKWPKKERKPKFRYESKVERKATRMKQKSKNKTSAKARRGSD
ncbi:hypothetical protein QTJ16_000848 [Diplocarpon rosae]|uniref:Ribosomal RNA-processing protein 17 n=1 Tax=Diplocarpon rosae TaxID=946125 RepID=A0AAD9T6X1_9HELO|nr:hypothetical protein QTJ16_000848 [Diplocarpon rosae]PBP25120.1 protein required for cell viability [Diplocarpon rosae]